jgi:hypothetical protein
MAQLFTFYWYSTNGCVMEDKRNLDPEQERNQENHDDKQKKSRSGSAANLDSIMRSATDAARSHRHHTTWSNTGTNISYEGPTAPGAGGSVGTGMASGQDAVGARIRTDDALDHVSTRKHTEDSEGEEMVKPEQHNDELDRDTLGTP